MKPLTPTQLTHARQLRREQTDAESRLWFRLRDRQILDAKFRRQVPIGSYIADFCCLELGLVIELDGGQHDEQEAADVVRTEQLERQGFRVIRFWNHELLEETESVVEQIAEVIEDLRREGQRYGR
jgi:very-short-patch-repair endonuclease